MYNLATSEELFKAKIKTPRIKTKTKTMKSRVGIFMI